MQGSNRRWLWWMIYVLSIWTAVEFEAALLRLRSLAGHHHSLSLCPSRFLLAESVPPLFNRPPPKLFFTRWGRFRRSLFNYPSNRPPPVRCLLEYVMFSSLVNVNQMQPPPTVQKLHVNFCLSVSCVLPARHQGQLRSTLIRNFFYRQA